MTKQIALLVSGLLFASALTPGPLDTPGSWTPDGKALAFGRGFPLGGSANSDIARG